MEGSGLLFALQLSGCLAEAGWGGWKLVAQPLVLRMTVAPEVLEAQPRKVLSLLAALKRAKMLGNGEADIVWRERLEKWALGRLKLWEQGEGGEAVSVTVFPIWRDTHLATGRPWNWTIS